MKIAQVAPCWIPVPPPGYGGIELVVALLTDGLVDRGHDVTLFASGGSKTKAELDSYYAEPPGSMRLATEPMAELPHILHAYSRAQEFDVIHDHSAPLGCTVGSMLERPPVVHTIHGPLFDEAFRAIYGFLHNRIGLVSISDYQREGAPNLRYAATVYNGIDVQAYEFRTEKDDYLMFVGRMSEQKGAHVAIEVAKRSGRKLIIATKMEAPEEKEYFEERVKPMLTPEVELLGEVTFAEKAALYASAYCTLMPIQWPEPFGLVMTESMACGTPVIAFRKGSVPEIVTDGVNGFIVDDEDQMVAALDRVPEIDAAACRESVEKRFSAEAMVTGYEAVYESLV